MTIKRYKSEPTYQKYIVGSTYEGKGKYLGETKGAHKFLRHDKPLYQKTSGAKYFFEKV